MATSAQRPRLRTVLVAAIAGPLLASMLLTTALWLREGEAAVEALATQLGEEVAASVEERLRASLEVPHAINQANADLLLAGVLPVDEPIVLEPHFLRQLQTWPTASYVQLGRTDGWFVGVERVDGGFAAETTEPDLSGKGVYPLGDEGQRSGPRTSLVEGYDATTRPWYRAAIEAGGPAWSPIYQFSSRDAVRLGITAVQPVEDELGRIGVVGTDITLSHLSELLDSARLGEQGRVLVVEGDGTLVAASGVAEPFTVGADREASRMRAADAPDRWTAAAARALGQPRIRDAGERAYLHTRVLDDGRGLRWTIAVVLPEAQVLGSIRTRTRTAAWLSLAIVLLAAAFASVLAQRIGRPIVELARAAEQVRDGEYEGDLPEAHTREVDQLARAFGTMRAQLEAKEAALQRTIDTRTEAMRAAREADRAKSAFLANMSHELRTPLNAILGYAELLREDAAEGSSEAEDLDRISFSGRHLLGLIDQILDLARVEAGRIELSLSEVRLDALFDEVASLAGPLVDEGGHRLVRELHGAPTSIRTDRVRVRQILLNLVGNAAKFTDEGTIELSAEREGRGLSLRVRDTGMGIAPEQLERIFDAFAQGDEGATRVHGGTGLGLAISRRLAEALGGSLTAVSTPGEGSTFTLWLPLEAGDGLAGGPGAGEEGAP